MRAPLRLAGHSTLADEHEDRQKYAFGRDHERQKTEWEWIEWLESGDYVEIYQDPSEDQEQLRKEECHMAYQFRNGVAHSLCRSPAIKSVVLQLRDRVNVALRRIRGSSAWQRVFHGSAPGTGHRSYCATEWTAYRRYFLPGFTAPPNTERTTIPDPMPSRPPCGTPSSKPIRGWPARAPASSLR